MLLAFSKQYLVEYISSYIGAKTPFPHLLISPDHTPNKKGADSGQGESDEERQRSSGSSNDSEVEDIPADREVLKWKRGRVLGRGAFGKVWEGLLDSAKLIAVKEMELDIDSADKAQTVKSNVKIINYTFMFNAYMHMYMHIFM